VEGPAIPANLAPSDPFPPCKTGSWLCAMAPRGLALFVERQGQSAASLWSYAPWSERPCGESGRASFLLPNLSP